MRFLFCCKEFTISEKIVRRHAFILNSSKFGIKAIIQLVALNFKNSLIYKLKVLISLSPNQMKVDSKSLRFRYVISRNCTNYF